MAGLYDVTVQSDCPRNVVKLEQIMDAPSGDDIWTLVESARGESLMEPRRLNLVVNREPSFFIFWTGERLDVPARGLLSRVMSVASRSHTALPTSEVSLEREAALPVNSQSAPPSARVPSPSIHYEIRLSLSQLCLRQKEKAATTVTKLGCFAREFSVSTTIRPRFRC